MKPALAAAVRRAQAALAPKRMDVDEEDPLLIAAQEFAEAQTPAERAEAALALVELAQHRKS